MGGSQGAAVSSTCLILISFKQVPGSQWHLEEGPVKHHVDLCRITSCAPRPAAFRALSVSWAAFWTEFGSRTWCLLQPGWHLPQPKADPELPLLWLCQGQRVSSEAISEHGQAEGICDSALPPIRQPQISKPHESQGSLIYSWCFSLSLSLKPRSHSRRGTKELLPLSPSQFQTHLQPFLATDHTSQIKVGFTSQQHPVL